ncbi:MAG: hypothetical protein OET44_08535 [Gammaproteobacteria bacterium]|nr:hypothetical protein [Gammaproteobacteria bacterium]
MRSLPGLLVEYLINGVVAFLWIIELYPSIKTRLDLDAALLFIPALYVVGMAIDLVAFAVGYVPKHMLRRRLDKKYDAAARPGGTHRKVFIMSRSSELAEELEKRSSRDRIARGTFVNLFPLLYLYDVHPLFAIASLAFTLGAWLWFEAQSYTFEVQAAAVLEYPNAANTDTVDGGA